MHAEEIFAKWKPTGLLDGLNKFQASNVAILLENQRQINTNQDHYPDQYRKNLFTRLSIPLLRRVYANLPIWDMISIQAMGSPNCNIKYRDGYGNIKETELAARSKSMASYIPIIKAQTGLEELETDEGSILLTEWALTQDEGWSWYIEGDYAAYLAEHKADDQLDNEIALIDYLSDLLIGEITREVLVDLRNNADVMLRQWKNPGNLTDSIFYLSQSITRKVGRAANWLVTSPQMVLEIIRSGEFTPIEKFVADTKKIQVVGNLNKIKVYVDPKFPTEEILLGYKGDMYSSAYFYCPYIPIAETMATPEVNRYRFVTRYGKKLMSNAFYARIVVEDYSHIEVSEEVANGL